MAKTIPQLTDATTVNAADELIVQQSGVTKRATASELAKGLNAINGMVNIKDFGAVGDGVADDLAAFTAANNSGGLVYIPKPSVAYNVSAPIKMDKCACLLDPSASWAALTDSGNINYLRGKNMGNTSPVVEDANFWRFVDRVLIGGMANKWTGGATNSGSAWLADTTNYPGYLGVNGKLVVSTSPHPQQSAYGDNPFGIVTGVRTSDALQKAIALGCVAINDTTTPGNINGAWGGIYEVRSTNPHWTTWGMEVNVGNSTSPNVSPALTPNGTVPGGITIGIQLGGGGDPSFGPAVTGPSTAGIVFTASGATDGWKTGICFRRDSINGTTDVGVAEPEAIAMAARHTIRWYEGSTNTATGSVQCTNTTAGTKVRIGIVSNAVAFDNNANKPFFYAASQSASSVNRIQVTGTDTGTSPILQSAGDDTNLDLRLSAKGTGVLTFGTHTATSDTAISGFITIKDSSGNSRKLAVIT